MSKKLLMSNCYYYSENGLLPVMDGLICWLDGRDGKGTGVTWKDRSKNGNDFTLNGFTFTGDNGWTGKNLKTNFHEYAISEISLSTEYTIEVDLFVDGTKDNEQTTFFYFGDGNTSGVWRECTFRRDGGSFQVMYNRRSLHIPVAYKRYRLTLMGEGDKIYLYIDGVKLYEHIGNNVISGLSANFYLGCGRNLDRFSQARFNSVKIYNRVLTEEEIQQNYLYEQSIERGENSVR